MQVFSKCADVCSITEAADRLNIKSHCAGYNCTLRAVLIWANTGSKCYHIKLKSSSWSNWAAVIRNKHWNALNTSPHMLQHFSVQEAETATMISCIPHNLCVTFSSDCCSLILCANSVYFTQRCRTATPDCRAWSATPPSSHLTITHRPRVINLICPHRCYVPTAWIMNPLFHYHSLARLFWIKKREAVN